MACRRANAPRAMASLRADSYFRAGESSRATSTWCSHRPSPRGARESRSRHEPCKGALAIRETFEETGVPRSAAWQHFFDQGVISKPEALDFAARAITPPAVRAASMRVFPGGCGTYRPRAGCKLGRLLRPLWLTLAEVEAWLGAAPGLAPFRSTYRSPARRSFHRSKKPAFNLPSAPCFMILLTRMT